MLRQRAAQSAQTIQQKAPVYAERAQTVKREGRRFGQTIWGPFAHAGSVLWLEITGFFFGLFGLYFAQNAWKLRHAWQAGTQHPRFLLYAAITVVFAYFTFSSFYRASRKQRRKRQQAA
jgi:hypothetical protein